MNDNMCNVKNVYEYHEKNILSTKIIMYTYDNKIIYKHYTHYTVSISKIIYESQ